MNKLNFLDESGTFTLEKPENYSYLYFPVAGEAGPKSAITPTLGGDSKQNQNAFIMEPVSVENLHNNRSGRNFWCCLKNGEIWSAAGASAEAEARKFTPQQEESSIRAGLMWQEVSRTSETYGLKATIRSFVPKEHEVEVMFVEITNTAAEPVTFTPVAALPIYGRSADNIRDHRHVTSLLHRIRTTEQGVYVRPTLSFDERGHQKNILTYFVCGVTAEGEAPEGFYPVAETFLGEGGTFTRPRALLENRKPEPAGYVAAGKEAVGGIRFREVKLQPGESTGFTILMGVTEDEERIEEAVDALKNRKAVEDAFRQVQQYWQNQVNISYHTGNSDFDNLMRWVGFQPFLRRIYGCSFLPHHDYGKGGRGWRDLWQDCLALLMMNPSGVRQMILDNFGGVRMDGTNATIIGAGQGEFIADRNNITRVWMDHGVWPFLTTRLYMDQTGDLDILNQQVPYFKDRQVERGTAVDESWNEKYGNIQKDIAGERYEGTVLEHLLLQNLCAFYEVGNHNHIRLRGADWNDALDMAEEHGESVAFTCAYAGNLKELARYIRALKEQRGQEDIEILEEIGYLLNTNAYIYDDIAKKQAVLSKYTRECRHAVSGEHIRVDAEATAEKLEEKAEWIMEHIRKTEWVTDGQGNGWFNSYYDNHGNQVEGVRDGKVRMMLTGQVFALMSKTATEEQAAQICRSARKYLYQKEIGGYRINTDFKEQKYDLGRMFGFAYGEKENGAVFSHMTVMYANALYRNGYVREAYEALQTLADTALDFEVSRMYPGIPEYFNSEGRGMYAYLTGAASWYLLTMVTEVFGVKGENGNLILDPKLVAEQFNAAGIASVELNFAGKRFQVCYYNANHKDYGAYRIRCAILDEIVEYRPQEGRICLESHQIEKLSENIHRIDVELE